MKAFSMPKVVSENFAYRSKTVSGAAGVAEDLMCIWVVSFTVNTHNYGYVWVWDGAEMRTFWAPA
jgi:hypothetical protein